MQFNLVPTKALPASPGWHGTCKKLLVILVGIFAITAQPAYGYRFVVYGDSRAAKGDPSIINRPILGAINSQIRHLSPKPRFVFFLGDDVLPGWAYNYTHNNLHTWARFMKQTLGKIPCYTAVGNNDLYGNTGWTEFPLQTEYQRFFAHLPSNGPEHYKKLAYSLEYGHGKERSLFIVIDSFGFYKKDGSLVNFDNGIDEEQLKWVGERAKSQKARYKFVLSHGPAFSIEGWPVHPSIKQVWDIMDTHHFDGFYSAHEHIFSRWPITKKVYPKAKHTMTQTIVGSAGSPLDDISLVKVNFHQAHIYRGYTYIVVDIHDNKMVQTSYTVIPTHDGWTSRVIDKFVRKK